VFDRLLGLTSERLATSKVVKRCRVAARFEGAPPPFNHADVVAGFDTLAIERTKAIGYPVIVATFASSGTATVFDCHGLALDELQPVEVADDVRVTPSPPERRDDATRGSSTVAE
jgi:hypothetical protein